MEVKRKNEKSMKNVHFDDCKSKCNTQKKGGQVRLVLQKPGGAFSLANFYPQRRPQMAHLTEEDRNRLERHLGKPLSFRAIAESLGKNTR
jgi:hypothetical protein